MCIGSKAPKPVTPASPPAPPTPSAQAPTLGDGYEDLLKGKKKGRSSLKIERDPISPVGGSGLSIGSF